MRWFNLKRLAATVTGLSVVVGAAFGIYSFLTNEFAKAADHKKLEQRVNRNELQYTHRQALDNMYFLEDQATKHPDNKDIQRRLAESKKRVEKLEKQLGK